MTGSLLVAGTTSDAGKSVLTAGICRWLARQGVRVAPFKAQNMALNSMVTAGGAEIGRAQAMQAAAAGVEPEADMNPVLLKPGAYGPSQVVLLGEPLAEVDAMSYRTIREHLMVEVLAAYDRLSDRFDMVVCEGAGSPAEINLRSGDLANMGLARARALPVIMVTDVGRGGSFASLFGTLAVLEPADQSLIAGFVMNKFRGDERLLTPGLDMLKSLTGRPTLGILPQVPGLWLDAEDSLDLESRPDQFRPGLGRESLRIAVVRLPLLSNVTDIDALAAEPGVALRLVTQPDAIADADLVLIPGTRATVADLNWLHSSGLAEAIVRGARAGQQVFGICGGYQMLAHTIHDDVESRAGEVAGLGLLPTRVSFAARKTLARPRGSWAGTRVDGYEIHHGIVTVEGGEPFLDGCRSGSVTGTTWHGVFENDEFRRAFLRELAERAGRDFVPAPDTCFTERRQQRLDLLADLVEQHLDTAALMSLLDYGAPATLPVIRCELVRR